MRDCTSGISPSDKSKPTRHILLGIIFALSVCSFALTQLPFLEYIYSDRESVTFENMTNMASSGGAAGEVYFVSHGGAFSLLETQSRAYQAWRDFGSRLKASKPKGVVLVSAHWESHTSDNGVLVNEDKSNPIIYDFYGFDDVFYRMKIDSKGDDGLSNALYGALAEGNVPYQKIKSRGLDHGAWIPLLAGLGSSTDIPIVQVSLPGDGSPISSIKLGQALGRLRAQGYTLVGTGQIVHNLRDIRSGRPMPYTDPFLKATVDAVASTSLTQAVLELTRHPMFRSAHPTIEHFLPFLVTAAAADSVIDTQVEELWVGTDDQFGLGWGTWRWYSVSAWDRR